LRGEQEGGSDGWVGNEAGERVEEAVELGSRARAHGAGEGVEAVGGGGALAEGVVRLVNTHGRGLVRIKHVHQHRHARLRDRPACGNSQALGNSIHILCQPRPDALRLRHTGLLPGSLTVGGAFR